MLRDSEGNPVSRAGKPLYNLDHVPPEITDAEVYDHNWESSISLCRTSTNGSPVPLWNVYSLDPLDPRLDLGYLVDPTAETISRIMQEEVDKGYEGIILRQGTTWLKVKPTMTYDVEVIGIKEGKGRNKGRVGSLITEMGNVGSGLNDKLREELYDKVGYIIEVECMELTSKGKFRHPRFIRVREDK